VARAEGEQFEPVGAGLERADHLGATWIASSALIAVRFVSLY
jgi:hypothetical protein